MKELETKEVDLTLAKEQEQNKPLTKAQLKQQQQEYAAQKKEFDARRNAEKTFLKKESDFMELEYKYMELMMALPNMRAKFQEFMNKAQADLQQPVKKTEDLTPVPDNVIKMEPGTVVEKTE